MMQRCRAVLLGALLLLAASGCSAVDDARDVLDTVDEAVAVLQDLERNGAWDAISRGLDGLAAHDAGYAAVLTVQAGAAGPVGAFDGAPEQDVTIRWQVDGEGQAWAEARAGGTAETYFVAGDPASPDPAAVYRLDGDEAVCATEGEAVSLLRAGLRGLFGGEGPEAAGLQRLAVATEAGEASVAGRAGNAYRLEPRIEQALAVVREFDDPELATRLEDAGRFKLAGSLVLDAETGALLRFEGDHTRVDAGRRAVTTFEVTQWGDVPDVPTPPIAVPCG